ncbi:MAG: hypothetical protein PHT44_03245 [Candidatus Portnoybacteria bacterium]|nr:hypothetical protein [Candidatus Portnoybacteria bacterium]MDD4982556.1 hypothetical protein [Candidatus Portnoybacteria bacterium]
MFNPEKMLVNNMEAPKVSLLPEELEKVKKEGGQEAVIKLQERMKKAEELLKLKAAEDAVKELEKSQRKDLAA